ncbi:MAG TPA: VWA domain-containing protein [Pyrinomonadaceae bacterium]|nr:VWA domain-containing protein [Pyrinomonadaceae bacterium]
MKSRRLKPIIVLIAAAIFAVALYTSGLTAQSATDAPRQPASQTLPSAQPSPTPPKEEETISSDEVLRVETNLTNVFFTAADKHKRFISTLKREDVRVLEDGVAQEIFTFQKSLELPLSLAILIDTSRSEERVLPELKSAAQLFLEAVMRANKDEAAVVSFTGEPTLEQGLTGNVSRLRRAIERVEYVPPSGLIGGGVVVGGTPPISDTQQMLAGSTAIWDAVWTASNEILRDSVEHTRRAIILLTDGQDTSSQVHLRDAIDSAVKVDALVYAIGIGDRYADGVDEGSLKKITEATGGRAYFPRNERELRDAFAQIQRDLREQYLIAYSSSNKGRDGAYRRVNIEITNPELQKQALKLIYRPGYFAKSPGTLAPKSAQKP